MQAVKYKFGRTADQRVTGSFGLPKTGDSDAVFAFSNRPTNSVSVENIPDHFDRRTLVSLFSNLIGKVCSFQDIRDGPTPRLDILFSDRDSAEKALCMNGYLVGGSPLTVSALTVSSPVARINKDSSDDRRNLYVLGLPFALTKNEFVSLFTQYGTVSHCVILATVDNSSRRRGFVVMSTHEEAKVAMSALTRTQIKGHTIDVSWAVVQRSQGFLDGGDRAMLLDSRSHLASSNPMLYDRNSIPSSDTSDSSLGSLDADTASLTTRPLPSSSLLVGNLPTLLFSQAQDLQPLFFPFGHIEKLEIVQVSNLGTMSVIVRYATTSAAKEAKESLDGQLYGNYKIQACYVGPSITAIPSTSQTLSACGLSTGDKKVANFCYPYDYVQHARGAVDHLGSFGGPPTVKGDQQFRYSGSSASFLGPSTSENYKLFANDRSSLSGTYRTYSNDFNDFDESRPSSGSSRWSVDQAYDAAVAEHQQQREYAMLSRRMHFNTVYPSSAA